MQDHRLLIIHLGILGIGCTSACDVPLQQFHRERVQQAYVKASNTAGSSFFGIVALSANGSTLAVGAPGEDSATTGIDGDQADTRADSAGAVYIWTLNGMAWSQQAYIKASNTGAGDRFGSCVTLSADGATLAVGAPSEANATTGIDGNQTDNSAMRAGAVYVFTLSGASWTQQAYIKASNVGVGDEFGLSVALSADGSTLAVGAPGEDSAAIGIGGTQTSNIAMSAGAAYVFTRSGTAWSQQAYVKASNTGADDTFGVSVALSADGSSLAVGAEAEDSAATGTNSNQADNSASGAGAVYVFTRSGTMWNQQAYIKASNTGAADKFGHSVALSADSSTLAVGAIDEDSAATEIDGNESDNTAASAGAVYVFTREGATWNQQAYIKSSNADIDDGFGYNIALSTDGAILAVGAPNEDSAALGIEGDQANNTARNAGAAYVFTRLDTTWSQQQYVKASNTGAYDTFGIVALSADSLTLAVGATLEDSASSGINGNQADETAMSAGAVYVFR